ncbi:PREDICTED: CKLF-like MARVEL transmembrane domain-containing protein 7 isoform X1 [Bison bison bison]|uniref:CKLF-like MARVEL transmembrane domain-containing protein 7 isoform X1 n=1 Tax=Bison bison bison TaxID=43346 RepID=A0A6P3H482_BISBB|nr:PREDICTED: CKLF-like MARVEL transmembrane domain-containing protein 7 isoform X1 [Bison bison bison]
MSHGAGLVRTTCSSGSAPGDGVGAGPLGSSSSVRLLDPVYPRTQAAMLKVAQMATLLIAFICVRSSLWTSYSAYSYFEVVTICNLIMILAFYLAHLFRLPRVLTCISWPLSVREWPGCAPPARVRTPAGRWGPTPFQPTRPASLAASALNFPLLGGPLCLRSYWPLKLTFKLQEGCASHLDASFLK